MSDIKNAIIKIASVEESNGRYKIKDSDGKTYSFFETLSGKRQKTQAFEQFTMNNHNGPFIVGSVCRIGYSEKEGAAKDGPPITYKNVVSFLASDEEPYRAEPRQETRQEIQPQNAPERESRENFGLRLAIHGMVNGMLAGGMDPINVADMLEQLFTLEVEIENRLKKGPGKSQEDIMVDGIPF